MFNWFKKKEENFQPRDSKGRFVKLPLHLKDKAAFEAWALSECCINIRSKAHLDRLFKKARNIYENTLTTKKDKL